MKKLILFVAMAVAFVSVDAFAYDWYAGMSFNHTSYGGENSGTVFSVVPEVAYIFSDKIDAGVGFAYNSDNTSGVSESGYEVIPFIRYKVYTYGKFAVFARGQVSYGNVYNGTTTEEILGVAALPVVEYALSDRFTLFTTFGSVSYKTSTADDYYEVPLSLDMNNLTLGFSVNF
jgi:hypothetical protein